MEPRKFRGLGVGELTMLPVRQQWGEREGYATRKSKETLSIEKSGYFHRILCRPISSPCFTVNEHGFLWLRSLSGNF